MAYIDPDTGLVLTPQKTTIEAAVAQATDILYFASITDFPSEGQIKKVYVDKNTLRCYCWDWINSTYVEISSDKAAVNLINDHINNKDPHVTLDDKATWNAKVSQDELSTAISEEALRVDNKIGNKGDAADTDTVYGTITEEQERAQAAEQDIANVLSEYQIKTDKVINDIITRFKKEFISTDTTKVLNKDTRYYVTAKLTAQLPADPKDGDELWVVVLGDGIASTVTPQGATINGMSDTMALNLDSMETTFVFDSNNNNWLMY